MIYYDDDTSKQNKKTLTAVTNWWESEREPEDTRIKEPQRMKFILKLRTNAHMITNSSILNRRMKLTKLWHDTKPN